MSDQLSCSSWLHQLSRRSACSVTAFLWIWPCRCCCNRILCSEVAYAGAPAGPRASLGHELTDCSCLCCQTCSDPLQPSLHYVVLCRLMEAAVAAAARLCGTYLMPSSELLGSLGHFFGSEGSGHQVCSQTHRNCEVVNASALMAHDCVELQWWNPDPRVHQGSTTIVDVKKLIQYETCLSAVPPMHACLLPAGSERASKTTSTALYQ